MHTRLAILLLLAATAVDAQEEIVTEDGFVTISWTHPTQRTDGTALPVSEIDETRVWCDNEQGAWPPTAQVIGQEDSVRVQLPYGAHSCYAKTVAGEDEEGGLLISERSAALAFTSVAPTVVVPPPTPPTGLIVDADDLVAYAVQESTDKITLFPVGTVAQGTACLPERGEVMGRYVVDRASVTWYGDTKPAVVVAACTG